MGFFIANIQILYDVCTCSSFMLQGGTTHVSHKQKVCYKITVIKITKECFRKHQDGVCATTEIMVFATYKCFKVR
jgi:hypothetical protein